MRSIAGEPAVWDAARALARWLAKPRVRVAVTGLFLLLCAAAGFGGSLWTVPLLIGGALMVGVAWVGGRLEGSISVTWGAGGSEVRCRATLRRAAATVPALPAPPEPVPGLPAPAAPASPVLDGADCSAEIEVAALEARVGEAGRISRGEQAADSRAR